MNSAIAACRVLDDNSVPIRSTRKFRHSCTHIPQPAIGGDAAVRDPFSSGAPRILRLRRVNAPLQKSAISG
jgi:hypothetical protein